MKRFEEKFVVPIYDATVYVVVADDLAPERRRPEWKSIIGPPLEGICIVGQVERCNGNFVLFLKRTHAKNVEIVAHEVFHIAHRIGDWTNLGFDENHHEGVALLHGWLIQKIFKILKICK